MHPAPFFIFAFMSHLIWAEGFITAPFLGPAFPIPRNVSTNGLSIAASKSLSSNILQYLHSGGGGFGNDTTSFSMSIFSVHESSSIFEYHHTAQPSDGATEVVANVTADTIFSIGSISKVLTVYALLQQERKFHFDDPITAYIPELRDAAGPQEQDGPDNVSRVSWDEVTVGSLAGHMAGIGRDLNLADLASQDFPWTQHGLPPLSAVDIPACAGNEAQEPCSREAFFRGFKARHPVAAPFTTPVYSNAAFRILGYVLDTITEQSYESSLQSTILRPLNMTRTSSMKPANDSLGILPPGDNGWNMDLADEAPAGGIYSNTRDLSQLARSILTSSLLPPARTRRWLKPVAHTASLKLSIGAPWEIRRVNPSLSNDRVIDLYTKSGSIGAYNSLIVLIPDYDVAFTVLTAGNNSQLVNILAEMLTDSFLPVFEEIARSQAVKVFAGTYESATGLKSSITLTTEDRPALVVNTWVSNGTDVLQTFQSLAEASEGRSLSLQVRVFPTNLESKIPHVPGKHAFRAAFQLTDKIGADGNPCGKIFCAENDAWSNVDSLVYGHNAIDDFVFHSDGDGDVASVEVRALRANLVKVGKKVVPPHGQTLQYYLSAL